MFFKAILKFIVFFKTNLKFYLVIVLMDCKNFSTKNKYSILKYISSLLVLDNQNNIVAWV